MYLEIIRFKINSKCFVSPGVSTNYVSAIEMVAIKSTAACGTIMYFLCHLQAENCSPSLFHNVSSFYHFKDFFPKFAFFFATALGSAATTSATAAGSTATSACATAAAWATSASATA
jgi:hypothetical protein